TALPVTALWSLARARAKTLRGPEGKNPNFFPLKISNPPNFGAGHHGECHDVHRTADNHQIAAGEVRINDRASGEEADGHLTRLDDLRRATPAADIEKLDVQAVFPKDSRFIGNPRRGLRSSDGAIGHAQLFGSGLGRNVYAA